jgi:hypothetical protein
MDEPTDIERAMMFMDPRSPMKGRSPPPFIKAMMRGSRIGQSSGTRLDFDDPEDQQRKTGFTAR